MVYEALTILGGFLLGHLIDAAWARLVRGVRLDRKEYRKLLVGPYRIHHNLAGYVLILCGFVVYPALLVPAGIGVITGHRVRDRLYWFVERAE